MIRALTIAVALLLSLLAPPSSAQSLPSPTPLAVSCHDKQPAAQRQIVLLVHGFNSSAEAWEADTRKYLGTGGQTCILAFEYGPTSTRWVTHPTIGRALASRLLELAAASAAAGGPGRVIVVAHSMGGLATRCAADAGCAGGTGAAEALRAVITLGTPHRGTYWKGFGLPAISQLWGTIAAIQCARSDRITRLVSGVCSDSAALTTSEASRAFTPGSDETALLPSFPAGIPVLAIAGSVRVRTSVFTRFGVDVGDGGDLVVAIDSALSEWSEVRGLGGELVLDCGTLELTSVGLPVPAPVDLPSCWHGTMTNDVQFRTTVLAELTDIVEADAEQLARTTMPDLVGLVAGEAERRLDRLDHDGELQLVRCGTSGDRDYGRVLAQSVAPGARLDREGAIALYVGDLFGNDGQFPKPDCATVLAPPSDTPAALVAAVTDFVAAWRSLDAEGMRALADPGSARNVGRRIPEDLLSFVPIDDNFTCRVDTVNPNIYFCYLDVSGSGAPLVLTWQLDAEDRWLIRTFAPDV